MGRRGPAPKPAIIQSIMQERRREAVAQLALRNLSVREIEQQIAKAGILNEDGHPYSRQTIYDDLQCLCREWAERSAEYIDQQRAVHLAKIEEVERQGWIEKDMNLVLKALRLKSDLLGLSVGAGETPPPIDVSLLTDKEKKTVAAISKKLLPLKRKSE